MWNDATVQPAAAFLLDGLKLEAGTMQWPIVKPVPVSLQGELRSQAAGAPALARFTVEGPVTDRDAKLTFEVSSLSLAGFAPYLSQAFAPAIDGQLAALAQLDWSGAAAAPRLQLMLKSLVLDNLQVREASGPKGADAVAMRQLALADVAVDLLARNVAVGAVKMSQPAVQVVRNEDGRLNVMTWAVVGAVPSIAPVEALPAQPSWRVRLEDLLLEGGQLRFTDAVSRRGTSEPVRIDLSGLRVAVQNFEWQGAKGKSPADVQFSARVDGLTRDRQRPPGSVDYKGKLGLEPMLANGSLRVERVPVQLFKPYFAELVQLTLLRAEVGYDGNIDLRRLPAGLDLTAAGDVLLGDVHIASLPEPGRTVPTVDVEELLNWQTLALKGVKLAIKPAVRPRLEIGEAALTDFYSRLVITDQGRFNLQDVAGARGGALTPSVGASAPLAIADAPRADAPRADLPRADAPRAAAPASAPAGAGGSPPLDLKIGATRLTNGRIDFTDRFVRPNYSAALTELNGRFGAFESGSREMATLELRGRAAGTALLEIGGMLNPTVEPLALDIRAKATDLELAPLSPYAGKYAGYAIERGKLSIDVSYKIDADGRLEARNRVVLNQLTFGEKIESKDATTLPVRLAVALLKDRNGVIDIDLPVSGSVNDPQFSVGAVVWKVLVNLLTRAVTAPFSLLAGVGSSDDLSAVEFRPGTAQIAPAGSAAIDKVAKALGDRPTLKMTITGASDRAAEREAFQAAALDARLVAEQGRGALQAGAAASATGAPTSIGGEQRTRLLTQLYKDTELPNKPRNALGFAKDLPVAEMEALLKARAPVSDEAMRELALQRGLAVRDALLAKGLGSERIFLAAPKLRVADDGEANQTPRAELAVSVN